MNSYDDIMKPTGVNNKIIMTSNNVFSNSNCMFVEYFDVINTPWYVYILNMIRKNSGSEYFNFMQFTKDTEDLEGKLFEWYINRKTLNPFCSVGLKPEVNNIIGPGEGYEERRTAFLNDFLIESMNKFPNIFSSEGYLNFTYSLKQIIFIKNLVKKIIIYSESYHEGMKRDIDNLYNDSVTYVFGDLIEVLSRDDIPKDTTYVFSDVNKVYALKDTDRLNGAAILIADRFGYNYDNENKLLLDGNLLGDDVFNLKVFDNVHKLTVV